MRTAFVETLTTLMRTHDDIITLTPDMGFSVFENIQKEFPKRFFNTGVTEQSTIGLATGMALSGYKVFVYAQAIFMTLRCLEQVRLDVAYHQANVKIIGTAAGFWLNQLGVSHFALEDVGAMRLLPNMTILTPGDPYESAWATQKAYETDGPFYIRLAKPDRQFIHSKPISLAIGDDIQLTHGTSGAILVAGNLLPMAMKIHNELIKNHISLSVYSFPTVKPVHERVFKNIMKKHKHIFTIEEHNLTGGFGSSVSEYMTDTGVSGITLTRFGTPDAFVHITGSREYLLEHSGLSPTYITRRIKLALKKHL